MIWSVREAKVSYDLSSLAFFVISVHVEDFWSQFKFMRRCTAIFLWCSKFCCCVCNFFVINSDDEEILYKFIWIFVMLFHTCWNILFFVTFLCFRRKIFLLLLEFLIWRALLSNHRHISIRNISILWISFRNWFSEHFLIIFFKPLDLLDVKWILVFKSSRSLGGSISEWLGFLIFVFSLIIKLGCFNCI